MSEPIPIVERYRGIGLHDHQDPERLAVVRAEIDRVYEIAADERQLWAWVEWRPNSPESRLFAKALLLARVEAAKEKRRTLPDIDVGRLNTLTGGLDTVSGRSKTFFDAKFAPRAGPGSANRPVRRARPLD